MNKILRSLLLPLSFLVVPDAFATGTYSVVAGGYANEANGFSCVVGGGQVNIADGYFNTIGGGQENQATGSYDTVAGGIWNVAAAWGSTVGGGQGNIARLPSSTISGGLYNYSNAEYGTIGGGWGNQTKGAKSIVAGGKLNEANGGISTVSGGEQNAADGTGAVIGGGFSNLATANGSAIGGGYRNDVAAQFGYVGGGADNGARGDYSLVGAGSQNIAVRSWASVVGGFQNMAFGEYATVTGGTGNCAGGYFSWAGGRRAKVRPFADPQIGACTGFPMPTQPPGDDGTFVWADSTDADFISSGRDQFLIRARGGMALNSNAVPLGTTLLLKARSSTFSEPANTTNLYLEHGTRNSGFNFGIASDAVTMPQLTISKFDRATYTNVARFLADGRFQVFVDGPIKPGGGAWSAPSDARLKRDIAPLRGALDRVLSLRGVQFRYRDSAPEPYRAPGTQIGFVAQDVEKVFPDWVSKDAEGYRLVGIKGFEALTVEALRELRGRTDTALADVKAENTALRESLVALRAELVALREMVAPAVANVR